ncbi:probably inactive leucine-rich repeat receptor-like protein kinase IMK2 [Malania oleifera]|uniref:probably inactive leucine-rich repeat receptor-like protein kinase IMK2 n=1 Tax=Malania oleifera TaxID=397392 RepID=UPI0025AE5673|nr:probably inactive leucine-rich repeat receptor-like protein kinase IMK2 [Malania oleifera]XP_057983343.1 probably inactive leucine-rich repeat receptor-like protein kinase IMK2 [Malania oleifera]
MATAHQFKNQISRNHLLKSIRGWCGISGKQKERWKKNHYRSVNNSFSPFWFLTLLLIFQLLAQLVSGSHQWDGVIVTQSDYQALQAIKYELIDFKGVLRSWNDSGYGACSGRWVGIKCAQGQVIAIQLPWKGLGGRISEKISQLQALRKISLHDNVLAGAIPWSLGFLHNLRGVYLFNNQLSGSIPPSVASCPLLQTLDVSNNLLSGVLLSTLANSTRIYRLNLSFNSFSGSIPVSFTQSPSLIFLALQHNNLSGSIPDTWGGTGKEFHRLQSLTLDHNRFSGMIPGSLSKLGELEEISLSDNQLKGTIPIELGELSRLQTLDLSNNAINGSIPASLFNLSSLVSLKMEGNHLENQIPETVGRLQNLSVLILKKNRLRSHIPATIGNISGIMQLDLSENDLDGEIPASLAELPNLSSFNVSYNNLSGAVPSLLYKKFNSSSFVGNLQLCGYSNSTPCSSPPPKNLPSPSVEPLKHHHGKHKLSTKDIILIAAGILLAALLLCCILLWCLIRKRAASKAKNGKRTAIARGGKAAPAVGTEVESGREAGGKLVHFDGPFVFTADDLLCATAEIMGKSTYGTAYKATLEDGNQVAVKRLREKLTKGQKEFEVEVAALGRIRHPYLLALRAYYLGPKGEKLLVFDYMLKGSLASFLHARGPETTINWATRMNIAMGIARGLCYLHNQENMVHGNLTSSNILLDEQTNAKIAEVGLSRLMTAAANSNVVATAGTLGYRAPELSKLKKANTKTDVYSLGVIMLELLTGKSPGEAMNGSDLPEWVAAIVKEEWTNEVFDLELMKDETNTGDELLNTLKLALHCVDPSPAARPEVQQILQHLEEIKPELASSFGADGARVPSASE